VDNNTITKATTIKPVKGDIDIAHPKIELKNPSKILFNIDMLYF